ncbi:MAG TPA: SDR family NAD(P)-dependent oxidoreductase, partial [Anaerovoracaceae bacterium]|nr:SDR family NAD(P)-dependent oxidoreductase [Anaerovoracaceae bacterium]
MKTTFNNRNILITGGSSGIGLALAQKFAAEKCNVWLLARNQLNLIAAQKEIQSKLNCKLNYFIADVTKIESLQPVQEYFTSHKLNIDILINSAGVVHPGEFTKLDLEKFHWMM